MIVCNLLPLNRSNLLKPILMFVRLLLVVFTIAGYSQSIEKLALPKIIHYDTKNMGYEAQSWDIIQDTDGLIYIANGSNILIFDGTSWEHIETDEHSVNRSVYPLQNDSIYFGADGLNGLVTKKDNHIYAVKKINQSSTDATADKEEYWRTHQIENKIVFQTFRNLYVNQGNLVTKIPAPYRFKWSYQIQDKLYVNDLKYGIFELENTSLKPIVSDTELNENIIGVTKINNELIVITDIKGIFVLKHDTLIPLEFTASHEIKKAQVFSYYKLTDNRLALGTVSNGLYLVDLDTGISENINKQNGLQNNTVLSIFEDQETNLWLALDYGIDYIKLNSPLTYYYDYFGKLGTTYAIEMEGDYSYLGTNQGLYVCQGKIGSYNDFELLLNGQVWNIEKTANTLFVGHDNGAYILKDKELTRLGEDLGAWNFKILNSSNYGKIIVSGNYNGVSLYRHNNDIWSSYRLTGYEQSGRYLEIDDQNNIWIALRSTGVFKFKLNFEEKRLEKLAFYPIEDFNSEITSLSKIDGKIVITGNYTSYTYADQKDSFIQKPLEKIKGSAPRIFKKENLTWYLSNDKLVVDNMNETIELFELKDRLIHDVLNVFSIRDNCDIIPILNGFALFNRDKKTVNSPLDYTILIRDFVSVGNGNKYGNEASIAYDENDVKISYALPTYENEVVYQTKLNNKPWTKWTKKTEKIYYNLYEGEYTFNVRAFYDNKVTSTTSLTFKVKPPLYRSSMAYVSYAFLLILIVICISFINNYQMKKQEEKLLLQKTEKLRQQEELHRSQKLVQERKIIELKNSKLQDEIRAKSRELTKIAYINLNKNKILKKIKNKIIDAQENSTHKLSHQNYNELVRMVDYYISNKESKLFEINFDKSNQDFYRQLTKDYPSLTAKDLRLCAYLKMNLSSKEIASLMGISSQSVDVSRYRIRKKLNLDSKDNLTQVLNNFD